jgi:serine/threonine-protein kinase
VLSEDFPALAGFRAGSLLAGYRLEAQVGTGGMAVVFRARDQRLGRLVALKILAPTLTADPAFRHRFIAESRAAAVVDDPHIIPIYEAGEADGVLFIAMRFVPGGDLLRVLGREGPLPPDRAAGFISPVASALGAAHAAGLVHRDVKPANILVDARPGRPDHLYLSDFGVSKGAASVSLTGPGQFLGTPDYSAPEQIQGQAVDGRTDQYALACVAYQLLTGSVPFERDQGMAVLLAHLSAPPPSLSSRRPTLPAAADQVLARALAKAPEKRYESCEDFAGALREALGLAPYHPRGRSSAPDHPLTRTASPPPGMPGAAAASLAADAIPLVTLTAPSPAYSAAGQAYARPDAGLTAPPGGGEQRAVPSPHGAHRRAATGGPGPGRKTPRAPRPGRAIRHRSVIIAATAIGIVVIGLVVAISAISGTPHGTAGPRSSGTPDRSASPHASSPPGSLRWIYTTAGQVGPSPAAAGGTVYVSSSDGSVSKVYALDAATGQVRWAYTAASGVDAGPVVAGGTVYVSSGDGKVYALDAATGQVRWAYTAASGVVAGPAVAGGTVYVGINVSIGVSKVYALDAATGQVRWAYTAAGGLSRLAVAGGTVYVGIYGGSDGKVYALDAATGRVRWAYTTVFVDAEAVAGGTVYINGGDGKLYALDAATGRVRWAYFVASGGVDAGPAVAGGTVYVGDGDDGKVYALDAATGRVRWAYTAAGGVSSLAVADGTVYLGIYGGGDVGKVYALDAATGRVRWAHTTGFVAAGPTVAGGTVYVGINDGGNGKVYALSAGS